MSSERHPRGAPCQPQPSYPLGLLPTPQPTLAPPTPAPPPAQQRMSRRLGSCHGSPTSNAVSRATLSGHTYLYTPQYTHAAPRESGRDSGAQSTGGPSVCVGAEEGWLCQSGLAARAPSQHPGLDNLYLHSWVVGEGQGLPRPCIFALHLFRFPTLPLRRVWRPAGKAGATPPPEQTPEERVGWGWCGSTGDTTHPTTVAQARRGTARAEAGGWPPGWARATGRVGGGAEKLAGWGAGGGAWAQAAMPEAPRSEPGPGPSTALPGGSTRRCVRPYLAGEHQPGHLPPSGSDAVGMKGTAWLRPELTGASPGQGTMGLRYPAPPPKKANSGPCDQSLPREAGGPGAGNLGLEASTSNPSSPPSR